MILEYIQTAMNKAHYELLEDGEFYGEVPDLAGVLASGSTLEECRTQLQEVLEGWLLLRVSRNLEIPDLDGHRIEYGSAA